MSAPKLATKNVIKKKLFGVTSCYFSNCQNLTLVYALLVRTRITKLQKNKKSQSRTASLKKGENSSRNCLEGETSHRGDPSISVLKEINLRK